MSPEEKNLKRKVLLKSQAIKILRQEKEALKEKLFLLKMKGMLEDQMQKRFDPKLSGKLDAVLILMEN
jgi:hypothetical protein